MCTSRGPCTPPVTMASHSPEPRSCSSGRCRVGAWVTGHWAFAAFVTLREGVNLLFGNWPVMRSPASPVHYGH
jgi:hypothetical protein